MSSIEKDFARDLKEEFKSLSEFEALKIACEVRRNNILKLAFGVKEMSDAVTNLEAIAMSLDKIGSALEDAN